MLFHQVIGFEMRAGPGAYCDIHTIAEPQVSAITEDIPCPDCGAPIPPFEGFSQCQSCDKSLFALSSCGKRVILVSELEDISMATR